MKKQIGRYIIKEELGAGPMANVYLADDSSFGQEVVVKELASHLHLIDTPYRTDFEEVAQIMADLKHPAIVPVYKEKQPGIFHRLLWKVLFEWWRGDQIPSSQPYFVMRYMTGGSLLARLQKEGPLPLTEVCHILTCLADALDKVHEQNVIHCNIKPTNVLFDEEGKPYLADFGMARVVVGEDNIVIGTPGKMAPEQLRGEALDARTDVYQLGAILFEMLTGDLPS